VSVHVHGSDAAVADHNPAALGSTSCLSGPGCGIAAAAAQKQHSGRCTGHLSKELPTIGHYSLLFLNVRQSLNLGQQARAR
jgi:hypothetical protein